MRYVQAKRWENAYHCDAIEIDEITEDRKKVSWDASSDSFSVAIVCFSYPSHLAALAHILVISRR